MNQGVNMKVRKIKAMRIICIVLICLIAAYLVVQLIRCNTEVKKAYKRLNTYDAKTLTLKYGSMTYVDKGKGEAILVVHGICGGYDQAYDTVKDRFSDYRVIAPSRFGYLGSDVPENPVPKEQAKAYVELLDKLGIDKAYVLATSAGGTDAIRFALDYPERTKGLILYCSAAPLTKQPDSYPKYQGPPSILCYNFPMWLMSPLFESLMGMESSTIYSMLPVSERHDGMVIDASITNLDMARNFNEYPIESLKVKTLIFHAKDDKLSKYETMKKALTRFPNCTFVSFDTGGHLMNGHSKEIEKTLREFIEH
jgi:pimeloyl-ACP methyl ester carboxylesterase